MQAIEQIYIHTHLIAYIYHSALNHVKTSRRGLALILSQGINELVSPFRPETQIGLGGPDILDE